MANRVYPRIRFGLRWPALSPDPTLMESLSFSMEFYSDQDRGHPFLEQRIVIRPVEHGTAEIERQTALVFGWCAKKTPPGLMPTEPLIGDVVSRAIHMPDTTFNICRVNIDGTELAQPTHTLYNDRKGGA